MALLRTAEIEPGVLGDLLRSALVPRPIAWVSAQGSDGEIHLAPCFDVVLIGHERPQIALSFSAPDGLLPSIASDIEECGAFVVHAVDESHAHEMAETIDEDAEEPMPVESLPGVELPVARIAGVPLAIECELTEMLQPEASDGLLVFGTPRVWHIDDRVLGTDGLIDAHRLRPVGKLGAGAYCPVREVFSLEPPP